MAIEFGLIATLISIGIVTALTSVESNLSSTFQTVAGNYRRWAHQPRRSFGAALSLWMKGSQCSASNGCAAPPVFTAWTRRSIWRHSKTRSATRMSGSGVAGSAQGAHHATGRLVWLFLQ